MSHAADPIKALAAAAAGLLVPSESEHPFAAFRWTSAQPLSAEALIAALRLPTDTPVETRALADWFAPLTREADWMDAGQRAQAARFAALQAQIAATLADVVVYRVGRVQISVIIAGRTPAGRIGGLRTTVIET